MSPEQAHEEEEHDENEVEKEGVLHEESFHRNPSMRLNHHARSRVQLAEETAIHIWHRLPLLQVWAFRQPLVCLSGALHDGQVQSAGWNTHFCSSGSWMAMLAAICSHLQLMGGTARHIWLHLPLLRT